MELLKIWYQVSEEEWLRRYFARKWGIKLQGEVLRNFIDEIINLMKELPLVDTQDTKRVDSISQSIISKLEQIDNKYPEIEETQKTKIINHVLNYTIPFAWLNKYQNPIIEAEEQFHIKDRYRRAINIYGYRPMTEEQILKLIEEL